ncbi:MAG: hypothetical protein NC324_02635 [Bacteroides sp.]|nr:hypothetical protein [Bacteroides sp.]
MFNDLYGLTEAVLDGRKMQTRRVEFDEEDQKALQACAVQNFNPFIGRYGGVMVNNIEGVVLFSKPPRYKIGEIVAVAQSYKDAGVRFIPEEDEEFGCYDFPAEQTKGWTNKMFVRAGLMPHHILITGIRVERLQDISDEDCISEGIMHREFMNTWDEYYFDMVGDAVNHKTFKTPRKAYAALTDKVSGKGTWDSNPYVVVYDFELIG